MGRRAEHRNPARERGNRARRSLRGGSSLGVALPLHVVPCLMHPGAERGA